MPKQLRQYAYDFEWKHSGNQATIVNMTVKTPRSGKTVSTLSGPSVTVFYLTSKNPIVQVDLIAVADLIAVTEEIKRERQRLLDAQAKSEDLS